jgi:bifunctional DNA-binding transcriptional regulator/antitoxin component of YhaV-PrlF toxin-antitoxin module
MVDFIAVNKKATTPTERGQVSMPASIRRELGLRPGQTLLWKRVSHTEVRVQVPKRSQKVSALGAMKMLFPGGPKTTAEWMKLLREGERA